MRKISKAEHKAQRIEVGKILDDFQIKAQDFADSGYVDLTEEEIAEVNTILAIAIQVLRKAPPGMVRDAAIVVEARYHTEGLRSTLC